MANELKHTTCDTVLTQSEFEGVALHKVNASGGETTFYIGALAASAFVIANDASTWQKNYGAMLRLMSYPVWVCDGVADEVELLAALASVPGENHKVSCIGKTFTIADCLTFTYNYTTIDFNGATLKLADSTIPKTGGRMTILGGAVPLIAMCAPDGTTAYDNCTIKNVLIDGNTANQGTPVTDYDKWYSIGIYLVGGVYATILKGNNWTLENVETKNCGSGGIYVQGLVGTHTYGHKFSNVRTRNNGKNGVTTWNTRGGIHMEYCDKVQFSNVDTYDNQGNGAAITYCYELTGEILSYGNGLGGVALQGNGVWLSYCLRSQLDLTALSNALIGVRATSGSGNKLNILTCLNTQDGALITETGDTIVGQSISNTQNGITVQSQGYHNLVWTSKSDGRIGIQLNACTDCSVKPVVYLAGWYGMQIYAATYNSVLGGNFVDNSQVANDSYIDISLEADSNHNQIIGNTCRATLANKVYANIYDSSDSNTIMGNDVSGGVTGTIILAGTNTTCKDNKPYLAPGEHQVFRGSLTAGVANAIAFAWNNPYIQDALVVKVTVEVTTGSVTATSVIDVGIADDAAGTNRGTEFFNDLDANDVDINDSWVAGDGGTQTKWVLLQDSVSATDDWIVGQILVADAAALVGKYYIEVVGR